MVALFQKNIGWFDISMYIVSIVDIIHSLQDTFKDLTRVVFTQRRFLFKQSGELTSLHILHFYHDVGGCFEYLFELNNIWVIHLLKNRRFIPEDSAGLFGQVALVHNFQSRLFLINPVPHQQHHPKGPHS